MPTRSVIHSRYRHIRVRTAVFFLLTFLSAGGSIFAQDRIEWESVEGADHYRIEIRRDGELLLDTRSDLPSLPLFLPPGEYEFRVNVVNTFGRVASTSEWARLRISAPVVPFIIDISPREIHETGDVLFRVRASGLVSGDGASSTFTLENDEGERIELIPRSGGTPGDATGGDWSEVNLTPARKAPGIGTWALVMTNPDGRGDRMADALEVIERLRPRIVKVTPKEIEAGKVHNTLIVEVSGMERNALVEFGGPAALTAALLKTNDDGSLEYSLNLETAVPGEYTVTLTNPSGAFDVRERAFTILPQPPTPEEIAEAAAPEIDRNREPRPLPVFPHSVAGGWSFTLPIGGAADYWDAGFAGLSVLYAQKFHNNLIRRLPGFAGLAWEVSFDYSSNPTDFPLIEINVNRVDFLAGLSWVSGFDFPVNILLRAGAGLGFSIYTSPDYDRDDWLGSTTLRDLDSIDFAARFALGTRIGINPRWYIDVTCEFPVTLYMSRSNWSVRPRIEGGWRW